MRKILTEISIKVLAVVIMFALVFVGHRLQLQKYEESSTRYRNCVKTGQKSRTCSVLSVFSPNRFNEVK